MKIEVVLAVTYLIRTMAQMGPFVCMVRSIENVPASKGRKNLITISARQNKLSRKKYNLLLDIWSQIELNDDFNTNVNVAKKTPQGWKENFFLLEAGPTCTAIKRYLPGIGKELAIGMKLKRHECPFPRGNYTDIVMNPELDVKGIPAFFYSTYKLRVSIFNKTGVVGSFDIFVETTPKKPK